MDRWSERQLQVALEWLFLQWNEPSRTDYYLMQLTCEVIRGRLKNPGDVKPDQLKIPFKRRDPTTDKPSGPRVQDMMAAMMRGKWIMALGADRIQGLPEELRDKYKPIEPPGALSSSPGKPAVTPRPQGGSRAQ